MMMQKSAIPVSPLTKHKPLSECKSEEARGKMWHETMMDAWVVESKYLDGVDDDDGIDIDPDAEDAEAELLFCSSDSDDEEDFFQGVKIGESDEEIECEAPGESVQRKSSNRKQ